MYNRVFRKKHKAENKIDTAGKKNRVISVYSVHASRQILIQQTVAINPRDVINIFCNRVAQEGGRK